MMDLSGKRRVKTNIPGKLPGFRVKNEHSGSGARLVLVKTNIPGLLSRAPHDTHPASQAPRHALIFPKPRRSSSPNRPAPPRPPSTCKVKMLFTAADFLGAVEAVAAEQRFRPEHLPASHDAFLARRHAERLPCVKSSLTAKLMSSFDLPDDFLLGAVQAVAAEQRAHPQHPPASHDAFLARISAERLPCVISSITTKLMSSFDLPADGDLDTDDKCDEHTSSDDSSSDSPCCIVGSRKREPRVGPAFHGHDEPVLSPCVKDVPARFLA
ncbi:hypothetical protein T484DRAFT_1754653 [Baffinella frigidus]|nr:hypothetical protein T484DRAFT_1754653 [Cryptophyta sp. CCMP2293]